MALCGRRERSEIHGVEAIEEIIEFISLGRVAVSLPPGHPDTGTHRVATIS